MYGFSSQHESEIGSIQSRAAVAGCRFQNCMHGVVCVVILRSIRTMHFLSTGVGGVLRLLFKYSWVHFFETQTGGGLIQLGENPRNPNKLWGTKNFFSRLSLFFLHSFTLIAAYSISTSLLYTRYVFVLLAQLGKSSPECCCGCCSQPAYTVVGQTTHGYTLHNFFSLHLFPHNFFTSSHLSLLIRGSFALTQHFFLLPTYKFRLFSISPLRFPPRVEGD